jgi:hypothetical protein
MNAKEQVDHCHPLHYHQSSVSLKDRPGRQFVIGIEVRLVPLSQESILFHSSVQRSLLPEWWRPNGVFYLSFQSTFFEKQL